MSPLSAHVLITDSSNIYVVTWDPGSVPLQVKLPTPPNPLLDGSTYASSFLAAVQTWNSQIGVIQLAPRVEAEGTHTEGNDISEVVMASTVDGATFPAGVVAITLSYRFSNSRTESDIVFNSAVTWNSYRGFRRAGSRDFQRVAIHELGHMLGLDHPDEASPAQTVTAIMNSVVSDTDTVQADDITGARTLYGAPNAVPSNDRFASATTVTLVNGRASVTGSTIGAGKEMGEPNHADNSGRGSSWWRWTPSVSGPVTITTLGSNFDTTLAIYTGSSVSGLTAVASNDDVRSGVVRTSSLTTTVTAGVPYAIAVDGWDGFYGQVTLNLTDDTAVIESQTRLFNMSVNTTLSANEEVVPGFVIDGTGPRSVLIRAVGPGLTPLGVNGVLADPTLTLKRIRGDVASEIASNDNWSASLAATFSRAGAFALPAGSADAALEVSLSPGSYTVTVGGKSGQSGQVIVEVYESNGGSTAEGNEPPSRFINLSANTTLAVDEQVVPGFVVEGPRSRRVLIRAIGPGLTQFGVGGVLADPTMTLNRISGGVATVIATNDNWPASLAPTFAAAGAFSITNGSNDAAIQADLPPGAYTVTVGGKPGSSGQVIVELYEIP